MSRGEEETVKLGHGGARYELAAGLSSHEVEKYQFSLERFAEKSFYAFLQLAEISGKIWAGTREQLQSVLGVGRG